MRAVGVTWTQVKSPTGIGVGYVGQVSAAASRRCINGARVRVKHAQLQVSFDLRVQIYLQRVVVRVGLVCGLRDLCEARIRQAGGSLIGRSNEARQSAQSRQVNVAIVILLIVTSA